MNSTFTKFNGELPFDTLFNYIISSSYTNHCIVYAFYTRVADVSRYIPEDGDHLIMDCVIAGL